MNVKILIISTLSIYHYSYNTNQSLLIQQHLCLANKSDDKFQAIINQLLYLSYILLIALMFFFQPKEKKVAKIQGEFAERVKSTLKVKLCNHCEKNLSSKVVFGEGVQPSLTCKNCQLKAVGNSIQKLSEKNLISSQKFANILTSQLISYQTTQQDAPADHRKNLELSLQLTKKSKETSDLIKQQLRILKDRTKLKLQELTNQSEKQNSVLIFEEVIKNQAEKKILSTQLINNMVKRSTVASNGVHFIDQKSIQSNNASINERFGQLKNECKVKLKGLNSLIDEINNIKI